MTTQAESHAHTGHADAHHVNYFKVYFWLLGLFAISVTGPLLGHKAVTLVTAFGIAVIKAYLVAANFMHLRVEKRYVGYLLLTALAFMFLFYAGVAPDVMNHRGRRWENVAAMNETQRALEAAAAHHGHHGDGAEAEQPEAH